MVVEVARVGVEHRHLALTGRHHPGVAVAHVADIVDPVHVRLPGFGVEKAAHPPDDLQWRVVRDTEIFPQVPLPDGHDFIRLADFPRLRRGGQPQDHARVRAKGGPHPPLAGSGHTGKRCLRVPADR
jgi:hypothetical protein